MLRNASAVGCNPRERVRYSRLACAAIPLAVTRDHGSNGDRLPVLHCRVMSTRLHQGLLRCALVFVIGVASARATPQQDSRVLRVDQELEEVLKTGAPGRERE